MKIPKPKKANVHSSRKNKKQFIVSTPSEAIQVLTEDQADFLSKCKAYWYFGEWQAIIDLFGNKSLQQHPESGFLYLLLGTALIQVEQYERAKSCLAFALTAGCDKNKMARLMLSGAQNNLARIKLLAQNTESAEIHYEKLVTIAKLKDSFLLVKTRKLKDLSDLGLLPQALTEIDEQVLSLPDLKRSNAQQLLAQVKNEQAGLKRLLNAMSDDDTSLAKRACFSSAKFFVDECFLKQEMAAVLEKINYFLLSKVIENAVKFDLCYLLVVRFIEIKDNLMAVHFINEALTYIEDNSNLEKGQLNLLSEMALSIGQAELAIDLIVRAKCVDSVLTNIMQDKLKIAYDNIRSVSKQKQQHGHDLLLCYLKENISSYISPNSPYVLIEVGTTRENVPGQGSTRLITEFCQNNKIDFITVDMDPNNGKLAQAMFSQMDVPFNAITMKGEEYLSSYEGEFDFIFLDAYDFDHGKHSALRQSRYLKYLGGTIDEEQCHIMHLDCAKSIIKKLTVNGIVCVDDTWQDEKGNWTAKGTLAVPFLLDNGFCVIEARNRAILLKRVES